MLDNILDKQRDLLTVLKTVDIETPIDWDGTPFTFALFTTRLPNASLRNYERHAAPQPRLAAVRRRTS